jgi:predicted Zn-dependent protease
MQASCKSPVRPASATFGLPSGYSGKRLTAVRFERRLALRAAFFFLAIASAAAQDEGLAEQSHRAGELMAAGKFQEAVPLYQALVKAVPGNPGLLLDLGLAQEMAGHPAAAVPQFEAVLKVQPRSVPALTSLAMCRLRLNQPKLAIAPLEKLIAIDPANHDGRGMLADALISVKRPAEAAQQYRKLAAANAQDAKAWFGLGKAYEALAANSFEKLQKSGPESAYMLTLIGDSQASRDQYRSAFYFYHQAAAKLESLRGLHAGLARVYEQTGHKDWAQQETEREANLPKPDCSVHALECKVMARKLAEAAETQAVTPESLFWIIKAYNQLALEAFDKLGQMPESVEIHALKADILQKHRQYLQAVNEWKAALQLAPDNARVQQQLAAALFEAKDYQALVPMLERALGNGLGSAETNYMLGASQLGLQQPEKAVPYLETALKQQPDLEPAHASLGLALTQAGRQQDAIPHLERAASLDADGSLHYQLARDYQSIGATDKARLAMQKYQEIQKLNHDQDEQLSREAQITAPQP